jgi:Cu(I)/Ag(I) efflux system membrane fusion protein
MQSGAEVGADASKPVAVVVDLDALEVHAVLNDENFTRIKERDDVVLAFKELPNQSFEGNVARIMTVPKEGKVERHAVIRFTNKDGLVKPGMAATASVKLGEVKNVIAVPTDAVDRDSTGKPVVKVLRGNDWSPTVVEVGMSGGGYTEIKSGLNEGDTVQVTP